MLSGLLSFTSAPGIAAVIGCAFRYSLCFSSVLGSSPGL